MNAPASLSKVEQIRARHGDRCWLCTGLLDFSAVPNSKKAPTVEHLVAKSLDGGNEPANLVLTHPGCNRQLGNKPLATKLKMRAKFQANAVKGAAIKSQATAKVASSPAPKKVAQAPQRQATLKLEAASPPSARAALQADVNYWRRLALISTGAALVSFGFALGLCVALLTR